jgi:hypothetical protein
MEYYTNRITATQHGIIIINITSNKTLLRSKHVRLIMITLTNIATNDNIYITR